MSAKPGNWVSYQMSKQDAEEVNRRRADSGMFVRTLGKDIASGEHGRTGHVLHTGNQAAEGDVYPALVVRKFHPATSTVNLQVFLDGNDTLWATSRLEGHNPGEYQLS